MKQINVRQKQFLSDITELVEEIGCGFLYGAEYDQCTEIDRHHVVGKSYKQNKVHIGHDFVIPVPKELHAVLSNHNDNVTHFKKRFVMRFGTQRSLYAKLIKKMHERGYLVPSKGILDAIESTSA